MSLVITPEPVPLVTNADGVVLVRGTRVPLDTVVGAFEEGTSPEEIVNQYSTLKLADVYTVIGYYLYRQSEVEAYLHEREQKAKEVRAQNEARFDQRGLRERLLARCSSLEHQP